MASVAGRSQNKLESTVSIVLSIAAATAITGLALFYFL
jgi:hypothetical protein